MTLAKELANNEKFQLHRMSPKAVELLKTAAAANQVETWDVTQKRWLRSIFGKFNIDDPELIYRATESWIRENLKSYGVIDSNEAPKGQVAKPSYQGCCRGCAFCPCLRVSEEALKRYTVPEFKEKNIRLGLVLSLEHTLYAWDESL